MQYSVLGNVLWGIWRSLGSAGPDRASLFQTSRKVMDALVASLQEQEVGWSWRGRGMGKTGRAGTWMHQPCHLACLPRNPCHPALVHPGEATRWQNLRNTGQVLQGLSWPEVTSCGAGGPGSCDLCEHPALLGTHSPQPTSAPHSLLSCPQPINYKSAAMSPEAITSIVG